jgi:sarcosine oxidase subunit delta
MLIIDCPNCGPRSEEELTWGGQAGIERATEPQKADDATWTDYLFFRSNPKGIQFEQWCCSGGCGRWFKVARHTVTHAILGVWPYHINPDLSAIETAGRKNDK